LLHQSLKTFANARVLITYGPTEAAVDCTTWRADKERLCQVPSAALGWPDTFRAVEVCAPSGAAVPLGCPGELRIFGPGLAKGYVTAEETSKAFVSSHRASGVQYRSGDAVRWGLISGLEFLGRLDAQVKVRGHRVELEEVESVLRKCPGIAEARLVAFVSPQKGAASPTELPQSFAAKMLPDHMVPHHVFARGLEDWPRSPTGKLDRPRLARQAEELLAQAQQGSDDVQELPQDLRTAPAQHFVKLLRKILRLQKLALDKPFTRLGGDSISAIRVSAGLREQGYKLAPARLLTATSVAVAAKSIEGCSMGCGDASSSKLEGDVEMSSMQTRFFALGLHNPHHYNQSLMLVPSFDAAQLDACFHRCLVRLAEHHDMLRASSWSHLRARLRFFVPVALPCHLGFPNLASQRVRPHWEAEAAVSATIRRARQGGCLFPRHFGDCGTAKPQQRTVAII
ncbi:grsA, partial [Symbiodinium sp. KB8]